MMSPNRSMSPAGLVSPAQSVLNRFSDITFNSRDSALPYYRTPSSSDFQVERVPRTPTTSKRSLVRRQSDYDNEQALRTGVSRLIVAKTRSFTVSGRIPLDPSVLVLFFRSKVVVIPQLLRRIVVLIRNRSRVELRTASTFR